ncbi:MAG: carboxylating nicotinate-nucleotide diphosphorylase [Phycisphaerales bacterium]
MSDAQPPSPSAGQAAANAAAANANATPADAGDPRGLQRLGQAMANAAATARLLDVARDEDLARAGDVTTASVIPEAAEDALVMRSRADGVVAGLVLLEPVVRAFDAKLHVELLASDGDRVAPGDVLARIRGPVRGILTVERTMLNLVSHLSGIATRTREAVDAVRGTKAAICDTRKTIPGMRHLQKYAVVCGGGTSHRAGLHDAALFKDNHLAALPDGPLNETLRPALIKAGLREGLRFVMVEVDTLQQLDELLQIEDDFIDIILLDNMSPETMANAVARRNARRPRWQLEASGGITPEAVRAVAESGVDRISLGALTHSVTCFDVGLDAER